MEATKKLSILVTGTNRGLGKQLALQLIQKNSNANFLFTSRKSPEQFLKQCPQLSNSNKDTKVELKKLDLTCQKSIQNFVQQVKKQHWEFDAIVNNAAMGCDFGTKVPQPDWAKALLYSNVVGTIRLTNFLLPLLKENGRVVNVSSKLGALSLQSQQVIDQFSDPQLEQQQIFTAVQEYIALCEEGDLGKWYKSAYATSKMMLNAWSRFILKKKLKLGQVSIAISPGHCATDMDGKGAMHSAESGAKAIYDCIFMENPSSDVFYHRWTESEYIHCGPKLDSALIEKKQK